MTQTTTALTDLAIRAKDEYRLALDSANDVVSHAIVCGVVLLEAQAQVPPGKWQAWCSANVSEISESTILKFCRLAAHRDAIEAGQFETIERAMAYLRSLGVPPRPSGPRRGRQTWDRNEARRLHKAGLDYKAIGEVLGVSDQTVSLYLNPDRLRAKMAYNKEYSRRQTAARRAKQREERDKAVRLTKGLPAEAYALLRRCALVMDKAISEAPDAASQAKLRSALGFVYKAEDEIVRALKLDR